MGLEFSQQLLASGWAILLVAALMATKQRRHEPRELAKSHDPTDGEHTT